MARTCDICAGGTTSGMSRSHSNIGTKRKLFQNLQTVRRNGRRLKICTNCLKTEAKIAV